MDVTLLYNGYNIQRRKMYTLSPRNNLKSQVDIVWPASLHHDELSPLSKIKQRQTMESSCVGVQHNAFVDNYLSKELNLNDSRLKKIRTDIRANHPQGTNYSLNKASASYDNKQLRQSLDLKLPRIMKQQPNSAESIVSQIIKDRPRSYFSSILKDRLKKYSKDN